MRFGLIGQSLKHSFSRQYFTDKFKQLKLSDYEYLNIELENIEQFKAINHQDFRGFNVTIPYKEQIIPFLDEVSDEVKEIGAVNTILVENNQLIGYNTDVIGIEDTLNTFQKNFKNALILGTGGASKAVEFVLKKEKIFHQFISRNSTENTLTYNQLKLIDLSEFDLIINTTPLGMFPNVKTCPDLNYEQLNKNHVLFDLVYNPKETLFLQKGELRNTKRINGSLMLISQAASAWEIWNIKFLE